MKLKVYRKSEEAGPLPDGLGSQGSQADSVV